MISGEGQKVVMQKAAAPTLFVHPKIKKKKTKTSYIIPKSRREPSKNQIAMQQAADGGVTNIAVNNLRVQDPVVKVHH